MVSDSGNAIGDQLGARIDQQSETSFSDLKVNQQPPAKRSFFAPLRLCVSSALSHSLGAYFPSSFEVSVIVCQADRLAASDYGSLFFVSRKGAKLAKVRNLQVLDAVSSAILAGGERLGERHWRSTKPRN